MKLLMESVPREPEKRTLPAHLECRDVFACEKVLNSCEKQTSSHFVGPRILISVKTRITVKLGHFTFYFFLCVCVSVLSSRGRVFLCISSPNVFVCNG